MNEDHPPRASIAGVVPLPVLGMGTAPLGNLFARVSDEAAEGAVAAALSAGIRYFDTAPLYGYGLSERRLGAALSHLPQESIRISTKVGRLIEADAGRTPTEGYLVNGYRAVFDYSRDAVLRSFDESLKRLRRSGVDVLLLHDIGAETHGARHTAIFRQVLDEALPAMQRLKETGACRAIGIGVNESAVCLEMMQRCHLDCILFAGRYTLLEQASLHGVMAQAQRESSLAARSIQGCWPTSAHRVPPTTTWPRTQRRWRVPSASTTSVRGMVSMWARRRCSSYWRIRPWRASRWACVPPRKSTAPSRGCEHPSSRHCGSRCATRDCCWQMRQRLRHGGKLPGNIAFPAGAPGSGHWWRCRIAAGHDRQAGGRVPVATPRATIRALSSSRSLMGANSPTKSVSLDFSRLISPSHWIALSCLRPSVVLTATCVGKSYRCVNTGAQITVE